MASFKMGEIVQLKSGGPKMTVTNTENHRKWVSTSWFAGSKHETSDFPPDTLQYPAEPEKK